jgi:predicted dehydrogenase
MSTFRGALIGCGFFAQNHMHGWREAEGATIVAVCDLDRRKAEAMATDFGIAATYTDAAEMLAAEALDFVDVATTVESHRPLVVDCLSRGLATVCQKPFAQTYADGKAMVAAAEAAGRPLIVHENFRWQAPFVELQRRLTAGEIGRPNFARLSFRHGFDVYANQPYLARTERFALMDVGLHLFDLARFLLGDACDIHCRTQSLKPGIAGEDAFLATLRHESGAVSSIDCSFFSQIAPEPFPQTLASIEGDAGTLELTFDYRLRLHRAGVVEETLVEPPTPAWGERPWHVVQGSVAAFEQHVVEVLRGTAEPQPSGAHNLETLAMALAAYRSADTGRTIELATFAAEQGS